MTICKNCNYCKPRRKGLPERCKLMKYKTIDVSVSIGQTPAWCPMKKFEKGKTEVQWI